MRDFFTDPDRAGFRLRRAWRAFVHAFPPRTGKWIGISLAGLGGLAGLAALALYAAIQLAEPTLPLNADLYALNRPAALTFLDAKGAVAGRSGAIVGMRLKLTDMPPYLPAAFLAMEDRRFYEHGGIDPRGLARAAWTDIKAGHLVQGGSTITQQLVKILFLTPDRTMARKIVEISGALALEKQLTKDQILELYLNRLYLGSGAYGVDGAARTYFGKSAKNVSIAEAAMLAALTTAPSAFSPRRDLAAAQTRADRVLNALVETHALTEEQVAQARAHPATISDLTKDLARNYFFDAAAEEAKSLLPNAAGDLTIATTFDPAMQEAARASLVKVMNARAAKVNAGQAALVAMTPDGAVRALMGGRDYADSSFNRVTMAHRQPGSAFKPIVYLTALEHGLTPGTVRNDEPITIAQAGSKDWSPDNYGDEHFGPVTLEYALAHSINTVAVGLGQEVGMNNVIATARRLGIASPLEPNASLALGTSEVTPLELTAAYGAFASQGLKVTPYMVTAIRDGAGNQLYTRPPLEQARVIRQDDMLAMNAMMWQVVQSGTGTGANLGTREVAGKTGTSADYRDAWFVGFSAELITGVWVGNDDFTPMKKVTGGAIPAQIWKGFMTAALKKDMPVPLARAEPTPNYVADNTDSQSGENSNPLDDFGDFLQRLFDGGNEPPRPLRRRDDGEDRNWGGDPNR